MEEVICSVREIAKSYGKKEVLKQLTFDIHKGEIIGIVGKSGAGKSTLMNIIAGLLQPSKGDIIFTDKEMTPHELKKVIGYSFQPFSLYEELSLEENIKYFSSLYNLNFKKTMARARQLFLMTDLSEQDLKLEVKSLSGGMKKRFDIVVSLLHNPQILMLDEPTAGLDPLRRRDIIKIIKQISKQGVTVVISSHIMSDLEDACDRILVMDGGKKLVLDSPENIKTELLENELIKLKTLPGTYEPIIEHLRPFNIVECEEKDDWLYIYTPETEILIHYVLHLLEEFDETIEHIIISEPDLSEIFIKLQDKDVGIPLKDHVKQLKKFVFDLIGKEMNTEEIVEILKSHKWPPEIAEAVINKEVKIINHRR